MRVSRNVGNRRGRCSRLRTSRSCFRLVSTLCIATPSGAHHGTRSVLSGGAMALAGDPATAHSMLDSLVPSTSPGASGVASGDTASRTARIPGIPNVPDVVTVVPFLATNGMGEPEDKFIKLWATVDGHSGIFCLDTGSPDIPLNGSYLHANSHGGFDTVTTGDTGEKAPGPTTIHTLHIGTIVQHIDSLLTGLPPTARELSKTNADVSAFSADGELGNLGLTAMAPFETIIDYGHRRVIFIRLDQAGRRLVAVPAYTPRGAIRLVPSVALGVPAWQAAWWGLLVHRGEHADSVVLDTGAPHSAIADDDQRQAADQVKQLIAAHPQSLQPVGTPVTLVGSQGQIDLLGKPFLERLGVVGFNLRTRQLILYR